MRLTKGPDLGPGNFEFKWDLGLETRTYFMDKAFGFFETFTQFSFYFLIKIASSYDIPREFIYLRIHLKPMNWVTNFFNFQIPKANALRNIQEKCKCSKNLQYFVFYINMYMRQTVLQINLI